MEFNISTELTEDSINSLSWGDTDIIICTDVDKDKIKEFGKLLKQDLSNSKEVGIGNDDIGYNLQKIDMAWHNDSSHLKNTHWFAALYGVEIEEGSSPTYFCNMKSVWRDLSEDVKTKVKNEGEVEFSVRNYYDKGTWPFFDFESEKQEKTYLRFARTKKSMYRNDKFGEYLFYSPYYTNIEYLNDVFQEQYVYKHHWSNRDLVIWNNMTLSHRRDDTPQHIKRRLVRYAVELH
tara:strand:- start:40 stop:741 length:702 start_codon:yes stop_codon:yes gene_type:complete